MAAATLTCVVAAALATVAMPALVSRVVLALVGALKDIVAVVVVITLTLIVYPAIAEG